MRVKQNITNDWDMTGKTTRAADQGWRCEDKKRKKETNKKDKILFSFL